MTKTKSSSARKRKSNPLKSGNPAVAAGAKQYYENNNGEPPLWNGASLFEKTIRSVFFLGGTSLTYLAMNTVRPSQGAVNLVFSNILFSISGGFLAVILLLIFGALIVNFAYSIQHKNSKKVSYQYMKPSFSRKSLQKMAILALALIIGLTGVLAGFGATTPKANDGKITPVKTFDEKGNEILPKNNGLDLTQSKK